MFLGYLQHSKVSSYEDKPMQQLIEFWILLAVFIRLINERNKIKGKLTTIEFDNYRRTICFEKLHLSRRDSQFVFGQEYVIYVDSGKQIESRDLLRCAISNFIKLIGQHKLRQYLRGGETAKEIELSFMPTVLASGDVRFHNINYYYQVFDKYGPSLKLCFQFANKNFTLGTISMIGIQMLNILEKMHGQFIVHRNLRPKKILTVPGKNDFVLIDFQQCVKFKHKNGKYIGQGLKFNSQTKLTKFSSLNQHLGLTASPKDDLESLGFILMYFLRNGDMFRVKETGSKSKQMEEQKLRMIPEKFCKDMPIEFLQYFQFVRSTNVQQYPLSDYEFLKKLFRNIFQQLNINEKEFQYDWLKKMNLQSQNQQQPKEDGQAKIVIHDPSNLEGIQEVQTELEKSSFKRDYYRKFSSLCVNDEDDKQFESVSNKMLLLPKLHDLIKLKH